MYSEPSEYPCARTWVIKWSLIPIVLAGAFQYAIHSVNLVNSTGFRTDILEPMIRNWNRQVRSLLIP